MKTASKNTTPEATQFFIATYCNRFLPASLLVVCAIPLVCSLSGWIRLLLGLGFLGSLVIGGAAALLFSVWLLRNEKSFGIPGWEAWVWAVGPAFLLYHRPTFGLPAWHSGDAAGHLYNLRAFFRVGEEYVSAHDRLIVAPAFYVYWKAWALLSGNEITGLRVALYSCFGLSVLGLRLLAGRLPGFHRGWFAASIFFLVMPVLHYLSVEGFLRQLWSVPVMIFSLVALETERFSKGSLAVKGGISAGLFFCMLSSYGLYAADLGLVAVFSAYSFRHGWQGLGALVASLPSLALYWFLMSAVILAEGGGLVFDPWNLCAFFALSILIRIVSSRSFSLSAIDRWMGIALVVSVVMVLWSGPRSYYAMKYPLVPFAVLGTMILSQKLDSRWYKIPLIACVCGFWISHGPVYLERILQKKEGSPLIALADPKAFATLNAAAAEGCGSTWRQVWSITPWPTRSFWYVMRSGKQADEAICP